MNSLPSTSEERAVVDLDEVLVNNIGEVEIYVRKLPEEKKFDIKGYKVKLSRSYTCFDEIPFENLADYGYALFNAARDNPPHEPRLEQLEDGEEKDALLTKLAFQTLGKFGSTQSLKSPAWKYIKPLAFPQPSDTGSLASHVCLLCKKATFDKLEKPTLRDWWKCLVVVAGNSSSNAKTHLERNHSDHPSLSALLGKPQGKSLEAFVVKGTKEKASKALDRVQGHCVQTLAFLGLPLSLVQNESFNDFLIEVSRLPCDYKPLGKHKAQRSLLSMFQEMNVLIKADLAQAREFVLNTLGESSSRATGFITVMHDGWASAQSDYVGVSCSFINPVSGELVRVGLGLQEADSHESSTTVAIVQEMCSRYGILDFEVDSSMSDTTAAARAASEGFADTSLDCDMHVANLIVTHALGLRTRSRKKQLIDSFPEGAELVESCRALVRYMRDVRASQRFDDYKACNEACNRAVFRLGLDNDTRISGTFRMFQMLLRSYRCLHHYFLQPNTDKSKFEAIDWRLLAEFYAILEPFHKLSMDVQIENATVGMNWLYWALAEFHARPLSLDVVETALDTVAWDANTKFEDLPKVTTSYSELSVTATMFRSRLLCEMKKYKPDPTHHDLLASTLDPVVMSVGRNFLSTKKPALWKCATDLLKEELVKEYKEICKSEQKKKQQKLQGGSGQTKPASGPSSSGSSPSENQLHQSHRSIFVALNASMTGSNEALREESEAELDTLAQSRADLEWGKWTTLVVDWAKVRAVGNYTLKNAEPVSTWEPLDPFSVVKSIDFLKWFADNRNEFPGVYSLAMRYLQRPSSNAFQEMKFSHGKRIDSSLRRRVNKPTFEMLVLLCQNSKYILKSRLRLSKHLREVFTTNNDPKEMLKMLAKHFSLDEDSDELLGMRDALTSCVSQDFVNLVDECENSRKKQKLIHVDH